MAGARKDKNVIRVGKELALIGRQERDRYDFDLHTDCGAQGPDDGARGSTNIADPVGLGPDA
jgi:hypothetical protein